jgi:hypothetical protein
LAFAVYLGCPAKKRDVPMRKLNQNEVKALTAMVEDSPCELPRGLGSKMLQNFKALKLIQRTEREKDFGP